MKDSMDKPKFGLLPATNGEVPARDPYTEILGEAAARSQHYLRSIGERHAGVTPGSIASLLALGGVLPDQGEEPRSILEVLDRVGSGATVASAGRRFFGGVVGGALPVTVAVSWLAAAWDQNACLFDFSPVAAYLEEVVLGWLLHLFGLPSGCGGAFVTGTQMADVTALVAARCSVLTQVGWDSARDGLCGSPPINVVVGKEVHATMLKALRLIGFGTSQLHVVPADSQGRMRPSDIPRLSGPTIICAQAGNVNTGACDAIAEISDAAGEMGAWVHVDGAFGLWAAACPTRKHLVEGISRANSWATDAHKWLNVPYDSGIAIVRDPDTLRRAMAITATYYPDPTSQREPMHWGPESSRRARALEIWAAIRSLGAQGIADLIERTCRHSANFAAGFRAAGYEVLNDVVLNQVLISFGNDQVTSRIIQEVQAEGTCWCGGTIWKERKAMRISVSSWATTEADVALSLAAILKIASSVNSS
jgi:glutamate/tyrosine decarboxylase-like PLP-dependent enzyme